MNCVVSSYIIHYNIFPFVQFDKNVILVNKHNYNLYKKRINNASYKIYNCIIKNQINVDDYYDDNVNSLSHTKIIRYHLKYYPLNCLQNQIKLYSNKLKRPDLKIIKNKLYTLRDFYNILQKCSINEINYVGW